RYHLARGEIALSQRLAEDLLRFSRQHADPDDLILCYLSSGRNLWFLGKFAPSRSDLEEVGALYDPNSRHSRADQADSQSHLLAQAYLGNVLFCLGFPYQAIACLKAVVGEARRLVRPPSLASSMQLNALLFSLVGDDAALGELADELALLANEQGFPYW